MATRPTPRRQLRSPTFRTPEVTPRFRDLTPRTDQGQTALAAQLQASQRIMQAQARAAADFDARMTGFINSTMRMAGKAAEIEGAEYGVQEAPDVSIIKDAYGNLTAKIEGDIVGDTFSIYGQAARKAALEQLSTKLEVAATIKLKEMVTGAIDPVTGRTMMTPTDLRTNMDSLVQNTVASAGQHSPMLAGVLGPKLTLTASTQFKSFNTKYLSERQQEYEATARAAGFEYLNTVQEMIRQGNLQPGLSDQMRKAAAERIIRAGGDPVQFLKDWETGVSEAKVDGFITAGAGFDAGNLLLDFHDYSIEKPWSDDLRKRWETLTSPERIEAIKALSTRAKTEHAQEERDEDDVIEAKRQRIDNLSQQFFEVQDNPELRGSILNELRTQLGTDGAKVANSLMSSKQSDPDTISRLELLSAQGLLTREYVMNMIAAELISGPDISKYLQEVETGRSQSPEVKAAFDILSDALRLPPPQTANQDEADRIARMRFMAMRNDIRRKLRNNEEVTFDGKTERLTNANVVAYAESLITQDELKKSVKAKLRVARKDLGFGGQSKTIGDLINARNAEGDPDPVGAVEAALEQKGKWWREHAINNEDTRQAYKDWIIKYRYWTTESDFQFTYEELQSGVLAKDRTYE